MKPEEIARIAAKAEQDGDMFVSGVLFALAGAKALGRDRELADWVLLWVDQILGDRDNG